MFFIIFIYILFCFLFFCAIIIYIHICNRRFYMVLSISQKLKELRSLMNMNQYEFAAFLDIKQPTLSAYERNISNPSLEVLLSISEKCNVSMDWLCGLETVPRFYTVADIILALKELNDLNGFEYNLDISKIDLATYYSYECKITLNSDVHKLWDEDDNVLGYLLEFIKAWKETVEDLNNLKNEDIKKNYI